jgi:hypothetical protein
MLTPRGELELAVLAMDEAGAHAALSQALAAPALEAETTANNLRLIRTTRVLRGEDVPGATVIEQRLLEANP